MPKQLTQEEVIRKCIETHGDEYDYSLVDYINSKSRIKIICSKHGEFPQIAREHYDGAGCPTCGYEKMQTFKGGTTEKFITRARLKHGDKYDYSKVNYINQTHKVIIICPEHGEFLQKPNHHTADGHGCKKCHLSSFDCYWTEDKDSFLKEEYPNKGAKKCSEILNCSEGTVYRRAKKLGLKFDLPPKIKKQGTYYSRNKEKVNKYALDYQNNRRKTDSKFALLVRLRSRLYRLISRGHKAASTLELIGCDLDFLKQHLENQFVEGMTWENKHLWDIDHIIPCYFFDLDKEEDQRKCFHYSNLRPLWSTTEIAREFGYENYIGNKNRKKKEFNDFAVVV